MPLKRIRLAQAVIIGSGILATFGSYVQATETEEKHVSEADCAFVTNTDEFLARESRVRRDVHDRVSKFHRSLAVSERTEAVDAEAEIPHRNFIDSEIFGKMAQLNVKPARLTTDEEFLRRIYLDVTGHIPSPEDVRAFVANSSPTKRDEVIDRLLFTVEFQDRWTMWLGDLFQNTSAASNINRQVAGRDAFYAWLRQAIYDQKSYKDLAYEVVTAGGNTFRSETGAANFALGATTPMGPIQDMYDTMLAKTASTFLGLSYYDCLLCHNGRGHLDQLSLWGGTATRAEAWRMAAFFSRQRLNRYPAQQGDFLLNSYDVVNATTGTYDLNTNSGNRPARAPLGTTRNLQPEYRLGGVPSSAYWRDAFAENMVRDPLFSRNIVNRIWKQFFNLGLIDPVDQVDPARLDPNNPPPAPWTLQPTHPELLEKLAVEFVGMNFNLRELMRLILSSSAYQLSSRYEGEWKLEYVPLFARHYPRRLEAEEIHDAIAKATGVLGNYVLQGRSEPLQWAMQMPDTVEPRNNAAGTFMNSFLRGNRDTQQRRQNGSIVQQLNLMNDQFVLNRIRVSASSNLQAASRLPNDAAVEQIFLHFLSRRPTAHERERALAFLTKAGTGAPRNAAIEDLAWAAINKVDFLFSY